MNRDIEKRLVNAILPHMEWFKNSIINSKNGAIMVQTIDIAKELGDEFAKESPEDIYHCLKRILSNRGIIVNIQNSDYKMLIMKLRSKHSHEEMGIKYLIETLGYKREDIKINYMSGAHDNDNKGKPDLTTISDKKEWEVKKMDTLSIVQFTHNQFNRFNDDVNILIFGIHNQFIDQLKFGDIKKCDKNFYNHKNGIYNYRFTVNFTVDFYEAKTIFAIIDHLTEGIANILTGAPREEILDRIYNLPDAYIRRVVESCGGFEDEDFEYITELIGESRRKKCEVVDQLVNTRR